LRASKGISSKNKRRAMESKEIKELRKKLGLTQKELAARMKVDAITVSRWERGEQRPSQLAERKLNKLAKKEV